MKPIEVHCKRWFLGDWIGGITIYPFIFYNTNTYKYKNDFEDLQKHEMAHIAQVERLGWFKFYLSYLNLNWRKGYEYGTGKYEREAREAEHHDH